QQPELELQVVDIYPLGSVLFRLGFKLMNFDIRSVGHEHIPASGGAVIASNHVGYLDFCFVALAPPPPRRRVRFVARREVFTHPIAGPLMRGLQQIEADPYGDRERAIDEGVRKLEAGEVVGIHPEGTISPSFVPRTGKTGAVRMAAAADVPIVPCAVWGSHRLLTKWRPRNLQRGMPIQVHYGPPFSVTGADPLRETDDLMSRITRLLDDAQAAYPEQPQDEEDRWWLPAHRGGSAPTPEEAERRLKEQHEQRALRREQELRHGDTDMDPDSGPSPGNR
ncbi:MAG: lysophospholipid acyltransferase family protein, partial [Nitriliruptorales bacterium]|nr:lysophospholipid acyltransferase family protein [Nitriliruptorales bacterium]